MPFTKIGQNTYQSPSGRKYNQKQVNLWYAGGGKFPGEKGPGELPPREQPRLGEAEMGDNISNKMAIVNKATYPRQPRLRIGKQSY